MKHFAHILLVLAIIGPLGSVNAHAKSDFFWGLFTDSTLSFGNPAPSKPLPGDKISLLVWNLHKIEDPQLIKDFREISADADLALTQESVGTRILMNRMTGANPAYEWTMAKAFRMFNFSFTGVATAYRVKPLMEKPLYSPVTEPISDTPKSILISTFSIENSDETLLVANVHAINFVALWDFQIHMNQLAANIQAHQGPMIIAGDFNTWETARLDYLYKIFKPLGLNRLATPLTSLLDLDHIFVRGLEVSTMYDLSHIESSDHAPLKVDLIFETKKVVSHEDK